MNNWGVLTSTLGVKTGQEKKGALLYLFFVYVFVCLFLFKTRSVYAALPVLKKTRLALNS